MKYHKKPPVITITEDDVKLVADKVQDIGEYVVRVVEAQREEIMDKLVEVHDTLQRLQIPTTQQSIVQQIEKTQQVPVHKEYEEIIQIVVKGSDTFKIT
jgi:gamma-glutamyl phosphate reductase